MTEEAGPPKKEARLVITDGSERDFENCAANVLGWEELNARGKSEVVDLMRSFWALGPTPSVEVKGSHNGASIIGPPQDCNATLYALRMSDVMASQSMDYIDGRMTDLATYHKRNDRRGATSENLSASVAFVAGAKPKDTVQSSLAVQMVATHDAAMRALGMLGSCEYNEQVKLYGNLATKLLNAYTRQAETLAKLQRGGEQVIKHVHIDNRGGQAVVTDQVVTGGQGNNVGGQPYGQSARGSAMLGQDTQGNGVSVAFDQGQEAVQAAWGSVSGRA